MPAPTARPLTHAQPPSEPVTSAQPAVQQPVVEARPVTDPPSPGPVAAATPPAVELHSDVPERAALAAEKVATWDDLRTKKPKRGEVKIPTTDIDGNKITLKVLLRAISGPAWDALIDAHQPDDSEKAQGLSWHVDTFPIALVAACATDPKLTEGQWLELKNSPDWSGGEFGQLFGTAMNLCQSGFSVPFTGIA